jgi:hypothetical protein
MKKEIVIQLKTLKGFILFHYCIFCIFLSVAGQTPINLTETNGKVTLTKYAAILNVTDKKLNDDDILSGKMDNNFISYNDYELPKTASEHWIKIILQNNSSETQKYYIGTSWFETCRFSRKMAKRRRRNKVSL